MEKGGVVPEPVPQNKMQALRDQTDGVIDIMKGNIERILEREVNAVDLLNKSKEMEEGGKQFKQMSQDVADSYCRRNISVIMVIAVIVLIIVLIIILLATGVIPVNAPVRPIVTPTSKP